MVSFGVAVALWTTFRDAHLHGASALLPWAIVGAPAVAAGALWIRRVELQLLARGTWWALLVTSCLISAAAPRDSAHFGAYLGLSAAFALLAAGNIGLEPTGRFQPVAFRGTLLLSLMLAIADAGALLLFGLATYLDYHRYGILLLVIPMLVGVVGLLRLRTWGLLVSLASNILVASLVTLRVVHLPGPLRWLYVCSAGAQLLVPLPMLITIIRRRPPGSAADWRRTKQVARTAVVLAFAAADVYLAWFHAPLIR
jgi:hypothetical protein